jgi:hypothetical protein
MKPAYRTWLEQQQYQQNTITAQIARVKRVEEFHGDLDEHFQKDHIDGLLALLYYTTDDMRRGAPNPCKLPIEGDLRSNIASYRDAVKRYRQFRDAAVTEGELVAAAALSMNSVAAAEEATGQRFALERDMQAALRREIHQLEPGLAIVDDGAERSVDSGFIDISARDKSGVATVIELKSGRAGRDAVGQILSYMGDIATEEEGGRVRGILVASDFDVRAKAAARVVPNLILRRYAVRFTFSEGQD